MAAPGKVLGQARLVEIVPIAVERATIPSFFQGAKSNENSTHPKGEHDARGQGLKSGKNQVQESEVRASQANSRGDKRNLGEGLTTVLNLTSEGIDRPEEDTNVICSQESTGHRSKGVES